METVSPIDQRLERWLAKQCFWDEEEQLLWVDCRKLLPHYHVVAIPSWDKMMMHPGEIPEYPEEFRVLNWSQLSHLSYWKKQIPDWVRESCALFPSHQLKLLHYVGRYPQLLELLDHSPFLAWRLIASGLSESDIVSLLGNKRTEMAKSIGWPGKVETIDFLKKLRLRVVNEDIAEMVDICIMDHQRLFAMKSMPRINSMALTLASHFPHLIGTKLHQSLAQMPCRPMQCQTMMALLEDVFHLADFLNLPDSELKRIGQARYLIDVEGIYKDWWTLNAPTSHQLQLSSTPKVLTDYNQWLELSYLQGHYWLTEAGKLKEGSCELLAWQQDEQFIAALIEMRTQKLIRARQMDNQLPDANQLSVLYCYLAKEPCPEN